MEAQDLPLWLVAGILRGDATSLLGAVPHSIRSGRGLSRECVFDAATWTESLASEAPGGPKLISFFSAKARLASTDCGIAAFHSRSLTGEPVADSLLVQRLPLRVSNPTGKPLQSSGPDIQ